MKGTLLAFQFFGFTRQLLGWNSCPRAVLVHFRMDYMSVILPKNSSNLFILDPKAHVDPQKSLRKVNVFSVSDCVPDP